MKKISKTILMFAITCYFTSCTNPSESLIKDYLKSNLNDAGSYEPVEFKTVGLKTINRLPQFEMLFSDLESAYSRRNDLTKQLIIATEKNMNAETKKQLENMNVEISNFGVLNITNYSKVSELQKQISKQISKSILELKSRNVDDINILEIEAQLEGAENRILIESGIVDEALAKYGLNEIEKVKSKEFILHKYRAKNGFGGLILKETIFIIDTKTNKIENTVNIENSPTL
jgi:hypothetical protein